MVLVGMVTVIQDFAIGADARAIYCSDGIDTFINEVSACLR